MALRIGGNLNFGGGAAAYALQNPQAAYMGAYQDSLNANKQNYANILKGYQDTMAQQQQRQTAVSQGYNQLAHNIGQGYANLGQSVQDQLRGANASNIQAIRDNYAQQLGAQNQNLTSRGLGNTTVTSSVQRGLGYDYNKAITGSRNQFANLRANYASNIGQAGLGARAGIRQAGLNYNANAANATTALAGQQLGWMNSVNVGYPDPAQYAALSQGMGRMGQGVPGFQGMPMGGGFAPQGGGFFPPGGGGGGRGMGGAMGPGGAMGRNNVGRGVMGPGSMAEWVNPDQVAVGPLFGQSPESYANQRGQQDAAAFGGDPNGFDFSQWY